MDFNTWMTKLDAQFTADTGFSVRDLEDYDFKSAYEGGDSIGQCISDFAHHNPTAARLYSKSQR